MNPRSVLLTSLLALLLLACGAPAPRAAAPSYPPPWIRADPDLGAGVPTPTPAPTPPPALQGLTIQIPEMGVSLPIVEGQLPEPHYYKADHYPGTFWPGEGGRSFIYAHAQPGMFGPLLGYGYNSIGKHVLVDEPGGKVLHYTITKYTNNWPVTDTSILSNSGHEEIILYTCTSWTYSDPKIVAWAEPDAQFITG